MQEDTKRVNPNSTSKRLLSRSVNLSRSNDDIRDPERLSELRHDLLLLDLRKTIRLTTERRRRFDRTRFIQKSWPRIAFVAINCKRTNTNEPFQAVVLDARF